MSIYIQMDLKEIKVSKQVYIIYLDPLVTNRPFTSGGKVGRKIQVFTLNDLNQYLVQ